MTRAIENAETTYGKRFKNSIYIGDGVWDYQASKELGMDFIGIDNAENGKLKQLGAAFVFSDFTDSKSIVSKILNCPDQKRNSNNMLE